MSISVGNDLAIQASDWLKGLSHQVANHLTPFEPLKNCKRMRIGEDRDSALES